MCNRVKVFLSYKHHDAEGNILPEYHMAKELYERLSDLNIATFFSEKSILQMGQSDYKQLIDKKLDEAELLIVVSSLPENCNSSWVRYEWDSFFNDILSERKKGELVSYLSSDNISQYPRTIRNLKSFNREENGLDDLIGFIKNYFGIHSNYKHHDDSSEYLSSERGSSYNYQNGYDLCDERERLKIQSKVESTADAQYIRELLPDLSKQYFILDVGCSMGAVTFDVFNDYLYHSTILGVDKFKNCVDGFNNDSPGRAVVAEQLDFENEDWEKELQEIMFKYNIPEFNLVYCSLSLHHMSDSEDVIKRLWKYIAVDGFIYIRTCDDALKLAYPRGEVVYNVINKTASASRASDRYHGRKAFSMLNKARFKNIQIRSFLIDTCNKTEDERYALFYSAFIWRRNYFKNRLDTEKDPLLLKEALEDYNTIMKELDEIESLFLDSSFYFGYYVTIAIAQKKSIVF